MRDARSDAIDHGLQGPGRLWWAGRNSAGAQRWDEISKQHRLLLVGEREPDRSAQLAADMRPACWSCSDPMQQTPVVRVGRSCARSNDSLSGPNAKTFAGW